MVMSSAPADLDSSKQRKTKMFHEKLAILNENFIRFVRNAYAKQPSADFTPTLEDYKKYVRELDEMYSLQTPNKSPLTTSTTKKRRLSTPPKTIDAPISATTAPLLSVGATSTNTTKTAIPTATAPFTFSFGATAAITTATVPATTAPLFSFGTTATTTSTNAPMSATTAPLFSFGTTATTTSTNAPISATTAPTFSFGYTVTTTSTNAPISATTAPTFSFGYTVTTTSTNAPISATTAPTFSFGYTVTTTSTNAPISATTAPLFSFGSTSATTNTNASISTTTAPFTFTFGAQNSASSSKPFSNLFGTFANSAPTTNGGGNSHSNATDEDGDEKPEEFVPKDDNIKPLVPLPPEVNLKSGEEDEEILFEARCKLFRYDSAAKENKDRGIGELKILLNKETERSRCVIRSNEAGKIMANFSIIDGLNPEKHKKPAVVTWNCRDFSEKPKEGTDEIFLAKFRDDETAQQFMAKIKELVKSIVEKK